MRTPITQEVNLQENPLSYDTYILRRQLFRLFGGAFRIFAPTGELALYADMKAFKLREDIGVFTDESKTNQILRIKARNVIDWSATYDVEDTTGAGAKIGALRRRGFKSMLKDEWIILDTRDNEIGVISEDNWFLAILRRFIGSGWVPQTFTGTMGAAHVLTFKQGWNPFAQAIDLDFTPDFEKRLERPMGIAAAVLLSAIEGRQE